VAALTALGIPLPSGHRVDGILTAHGRRAANLPTSLHVLPRNRVVGLFRALLHAQGVGLVDGTASGIAALPRGGFVVRVDGASYTVDAVVLCCGAGAPVATRIAGHAPPPALRAMGARFALASPLPPAIHRHPQSSGDLWILPERDGPSTILVSSDAGPRTFGLRLPEPGLEPPAPRPGRARAGLWLLGTGGRRSPGPPLPGQCPRRPSGRTVAGRRGRSGRSPGGRAARRRDRGGDAARAHRGAIAPAHAPIRAP